MIATCTSMARRRNTFMSAIRRATWELLLTMVSWCLEQAVVSRHAVRGLLVRLAMDLGIWIPIQLLGWRLVLAARGPSLVVSQDPGYPSGVLRTLVSTLGSPQSGLGTRERECLQQLARQRGCRAHLPTSRCNLAGARRTSGFIRGQRWPRLSASLGGLVPGEQLRAVAENTCKCWTWATTSIAFLRPDPSERISEPWPGARYASNGSPRAAAPGR